MRLWSEEKIVVPTFWRLLITHLLDSDSKTATRLWACFRRHYPLSSQLVSYRLDRLMAPDGFRPGNRALWAERLALVRESIDPTLLLTLCRRVAPETGKARDPAIVRLEEAVLFYTAADGTWKAPDRQEVPGIITKGIAV